MKVNM